VPHLLVQQVLRLLLHLVLKQAPEEAEPPQLALLLVLLPLPVRNLRMKQILRSFLVLLMMSDPQSVSVVLPHSVIVHLMYCVYLLDLQ
jgi:hypothetical protein